MTAVTVNHLFKSYAGKAAVSDLTFSAHPGEILGLIGPNGAGKSSTIKIILDFMKPDSGEVKVFEQKMCEDFKNRIGYLPEERGLYKKSTAIELILYLASLKGLRKPEAEKKALELLRQTNMLESKNKKIKEMSRGMAQVIQFIITVIHEPDLIILDEPFSGMDPVNTELVKNIICRLRENGKTIILSTHQMNQIEELCDRVLMINGGRAVFLGDLNKTIRERFRRNAVRVEVEGDLGDLPGVVGSKVNQDSIELELDPDTSPQTILDLIREQGLTIHRFEVPTPSLNEIFLDIVRSKHE